jgi:hypothetical protein
MKKNRLHLSNLTKSIQHLPSTAKCVDTEQQAVKVGQAASEKKENLNLLWTCAGEQKTSVATTPHIGTSKPSSDCISTTPTMPTARRLALNRSHRETETASIESAERSEVQYQNAVNALQLKSVSLLRQAAIETTTLKQLRIKQKQVQKSEDLQYWEHC